MELRWTESMEVGVGELDDDHRAQIEALRRMQTLIGRHRRKAALEAVDNLSGLMRDHFIREERMLASCGYPDLAYHARGHRTALQHVQAIRALVAKADWPAADAATDECAALFLFRLIIDDMDYKWFLIDRRLQPRFAGTHVAQWLPREARLVSQAGLSPV